MGVSIVAMLGVKVLKVVFLSVGVLPVKERVQAVFCIDGG